VIREGRAIMSDIDKEELSFQIHEKIRSIHAGRRVRRERQAALEAIEETLRNDSHDALQMLIKLNEVDPELVAKHARDYDAAQGS
jgi:hypothetical protein